MAELPACCLVILFLYIGKGKADNGIRPLELSKLFIFPNGKPLK